MPLMFCAPSRLNMIGWSIATTLAVRVPAEHAVACADAIGAYEIDPNAITWVVVGDLAKTEAPIRALNLGEVTILDADGKPVSK